MSGGAVDVGDLIARLKLDASGFQKGAEEAKHHAKGLEGALEHLKEEAAEMGKALLAAFAFEAVIEHLTEFGKEAFDAAVEAQQFASTLKASFGESADAVTEWSEETGKALHREAGAIGQVATAFNNLLKDTLGPKNSKVARDISQDLTELATAFETVHPGGTDAITMALQGRSKALQRMGIDVSDAAVQNDLLAHGEKMLFKDMDESSQAIARTNLLTAELSKANKNAGDQTDTWREQTLRLNAIIADNHEKIGNQMLPAMTDLKKTYADMLEKLSSADWTTAFNGIASGFKTIGLMAINAALGISSFMSIMHAVQVAADAAKDEFDDRAAGSNSPRAQARFAQLYKARQNAGTLGEGEEYAKNIALMREQSLDPKAFGEVMGDAFNKAILDSPFTQGLLDAKAALLGETDGMGMEINLGPRRQDQTHGKNTTATEAAEKERLEIIRATTADEKFEREKRNKMYTANLAVDEAADANAQKIWETENAERVKLLDDLKHLRDELKDAYNAEVKQRKAQGQQAMAGWAGAIAGGGFLGSFASMITDGVTKGFGKAISGDILSLVGAGLSAELDLTKNILDSLVKFSQESLKKFLPADARGGSAMGQGALAFGVFSAAGMAWAAPAAALGAVMLDLATHTKSYAKYQQALTVATQPLVDAMEPLFENLMPLVGLFSVLAKGFAEFLGTLAGGRAIPLALFEVFRDLALVGATLNVLFQTLVFTLRLGIDDMIIAFAGLVQFANEATGGNFATLNNLAGTTGGASQRAQADLDTATSNVQGAVDFWQTIYDMTADSAGALGNSLVDLNKSVQQATSQFNLPSWYRIGQTTWGASLGAPPGMDGGSPGGGTPGGGGFTPPGGGGDRAQIHIHVLPNTDVIVDTVKSKLSADIFRQTGDASGIVAGSANIRNRFGG